jgi:UDP-glucose 4-epimerase
MNILAAGGAGFIGSHLIDRLLENGDTVVCIDNLCLGSKDMIKHNENNPRFSFIEMDICDTKRLDEVFAENAFDRVYHLAANSDIQKGGMNPEIDYHNTLLTTVSLLDAMRRYGVGEMFFASTSAVYGEKRELLCENIGDLRPISYYGASKLASESFIFAYSAMNDLRVNILRFPNVVGERLTHGVIFDFIKKLKANPKELEILGDGTQTKPYIYVHDLVDAIMMMKYTDGVNIFNAGVLSATSVKTIADIVCEEMGLSYVLYRFTGGNIGWKGDVPKFQYDLSKIHAFGWTAKHTSDEAVRIAARAGIN